MTRPITVLFARRDSVYKTLPGCNVYDEDRDALTWPGGSPLIAHPPCRSWGGLRHLAKAPAGEHGLALWALEQVRRWGGVLEHPARSELWPTCNLPVGHNVDEYGGFSLLVNQCWWGHLAAKASLLYVCGLAPTAVPDVRVDLSAPSSIVGGRGRRSRDDATKGWRPALSHRQREATPPAFAAWLLTVARRAHQVDTAVPRARHGEAAVHGSPCAAD